MSRIIGLCLAACLWAAPGSAQQESGLARYSGGGFSDARRGVTELALELSQGVPWRVYTLADPMRLVLDFREVAWQGADPEGMDDSDRVASLRMGAFRPGWSRLVAELSEPLAVARAGMQIDPETGRATLSLRLERTDPDSFAQAAGTPAGPGWDRPEPRALRPVARDSDAPLTIVLDPGHGGIDPGAQRGGLKEADLVLLFARELREVLRRTGAYTVVLTRDSDTFVSLEGRVALAHDAGADLFISLHADALEEGQAHGASVYTLSADASDAASAALAERHDRDDLLAGIDLSGADDRVAQVLMDLARLDNTPRSEALARHLIDGIENALGHVHKRPLRQAGFSVLKAADIPSVLVELGFLSTERDLENLQDPAWRAGMAAGIRDGIAAWLIEDEALGRLRRQ
ncbi:N-acetylmuramoyl-L-alanine amidase [Pseudoponticoccus marisrubri]|uniref:N-acetylmuramoyl-L-alanine amidase n=1 Tax=Pseudoponticoccus marisrubri TaxID=1685382 RepID=A0A0W7WM76_9RHOB|nr:N-acetylmuramoyl-L-alanine amidase [Pseudoponticoccus marisrubri]KUF11608.1 N-acetylmuramoyl-L-alanine amidase [Pseudoponticoccus marisrubri]